jgi:predicted lipoprotein with Yx(FWY)xxD motif
MRTFTLSCALVIVALGIVACGGGSGYTAPVAASATATPIANPTATPAPGPTSTASASTTTLATMTLLGAPGFVAPSGRTAYVLSDDTTTSLACTVSNGCTGVWFPIAPPSGVALTTGFTSFTRSDNGSTQLAYLGHPLYTFAGDTANGQTSGENLMSFGGTWTVAHP